MLEVSHGGVEVLLEKHAVACRLEMDLIAKLEVSKIEIINVNGEKME